MNGMILVESIETPRAINYDGAEIMVEEGVVLPAEVAEHVSLKLARLGIPHGFVAHAPRGRTAPVSRAKQRCPFPGCEHEAASHSALKEHFAETHVTSASVTKTAEKTEPEPEVAPLGDE